VPKNWVNRRVTLLLALSQVLILATSMSGCGDDGGRGIQEPGPVTTITVTAPMTAVQIGQTIQLTATASDAGGIVLEGRTFEWTTADARVASVSPTGFVTAVAEGQVEIRAATEGVTGSILITVTPVSSDGPVTVTLQEVAAGLDFPLYLTSPPGDERLFIVQKGGAIRIMKGGTLLGAPFLDLTGQVSTKREQGLLGLAFPPDYASSGRFFVHYTDPLGDTRISAFRVSHDPDRADPGSESVVLTADQPGPAHNGGQILFGPDGLLYIGLGDGASRDGNDRGRGQSLGDLLGSILRIDVTSGSPYSVPPDNPFVGTAGARPEIWSYGLRNPWRFSFDRGNGDLYIADVGESLAEEVNHLTAQEGAGRGANFGWSRMEGRNCLNNERCDQTGLILPVLEYDHSDGCSVTGGYVYRGARIPQIQGHYFYADFCGGWVRSFRMRGGAAVEKTDWPSLSPGRGVTSFGEDAAGELYLMTEKGRLVKIVPQ
jgi:glucose/arabinose dehydrogenase